MKRFLVFCVNLGALACAVAGTVVPSLQLQVELDPGSHHLKVLALVAPESADFRFELHESLLISDATVDGYSVPVVAMGRDGGVRGWRVRLPAGATTLRLEYSGSLPALDRDLDHRGVVRHGLSPMSSTEGSFLPAGGAWYPRPAALFGYRVALSVPGEQRALVPGRLLTEALPTPEGARYRASFESAHPSDGIDLMAGPWFVREKIMPRAKGGSVRLRTYFTHDLDAMPGLAEAYLNDTQRYLELYSGEIGEYPFTEYSVVASPLPTGFGMPTLTYMGAEVLKLPFIRAVSLGHEVLHNWWGNGVYVDYTQGNWCEGLTTFLADYAYKEQESNQAARDMRLGWLRDFAALSAGDNQTLASFRSRSHGAAAAVGYGKSAMLFGMLRDTIGEDAFRRGLRAFWLQHRFKVASWVDLRTSFEQASGQALGPFFDQWLNRAGAPRVVVANASAKAEADKVRLTLTVEQSAELYDLRVPLEVVYSDHSEWRWVDTARSRDTVTWDLDSRPQGVRLDPDWRVWRVLEPAQLPPILRQWVIARAPRLVLASQLSDVRQAGQLLAKRLFEVPHQAVLSDAFKHGDQPLLLVGLHAEVDAVLAAAGLPSRPTGLGTRGSAQVWTLNRPGAAAVAVVSGKDVDSLLALLRPLPHYGAQSWLVFEGGRVLERGIWRASTSLMPLSSGY